MPSKVKIFSTEDLKSFHTGSLLTRRNQLLACEESFEQSDRVGYEERPDPNVTGFIEFKDSDEWVKAYQDVKTILATREHLSSSKKRNG